MFWFPHCSQFSTVFNNVVEPELGVTIPNNNAKQSNLVELVITLNK